MSEKPHTIKVSECDDCPFKQVDDYGCQLCNHPNNMYDGNKYDQWIEHCPLKERDTVITFERKERNGTE